MPNLQIMQPAAALLRVFPNCAEPQAISLRLPEAGLYVCHYHMQHAGLCRGQRLQASSPLCFFFCSFFCFLLAGLNKPLILRAPPRYNHVHTNTTAKLKKM